MKSFTIAIAVVGTAMVGCTSSPEKQSVRESNRQAELLETTVRYPEIGHLEKRDRMITIKAGPRGHIYTVAPKEGKVLLENLSGEQLKAQAPELHDLIKTGVANDASLRNSKVDAKD